ncbi:MAG: ABC transporter substrate-binding protein [Solirubrobacterales bacterium]
MRALGGALATLLALALAGCGTEEQAPSELVVARTSQPEHLDPALSDRVNTREPIWLVYTPLLTYRHAEGSDGAELIPGLAGDLPEVSEDGTVYRLELREGLEYSDRTEVNASDFEHAIKRVLALRSAGAPLYDGIAGAREYVRAGVADGDIPGIEADDETGEITITLTAPDATFSNALAMSFTGLVPGDTPFVDLTADPPPGVGPYEITESSANRQFVLERNPAFGGLDIPDIPTGNIERITTRIVGDRREQAQAVLDSRLDFMQDPPPPELRATVLEQASDRYIEHATAATHYFFLNHRIAPFDDPKVRAAVNYALDRPALAGVYGGTLKPGCAFLAPGVPGYDEALDTDACPYGDPTQPPDVERARELIAGAGATRTKVTVWGASGRGTRAVAEAYVEMLNEIGLDAQPRLAAAGGSRTQLQRRRARAQTGIATASGSFPHPLELYSTVDGGIDDGFVAAELGRLRQVPELDDVAEDWRELDAHLIGPDQSHLAPFGHPEVATFLSERIEPKSAIFHPLYRNDYSSWELKEGE